MPSQGPYKEAFLESGGPLRIELKVSARTAEEPLQPKHFERWELVPLFKEIRKVLAEVDSRRRKAPEEGQVAPGIIHKWPGGEIMKNAYWSLALSQILVL